VTSKIPNIQKNRLENEINAVKYMEVSSKTGKGVQEIYNEAVALVLKEREGSSISPSSSSTSGDSKNKGKKAPKKTRRMPFTVICNVDILKKQSIRRNITYNKSMK